MSKVRQNSQNELIEFQKVSHCVLSMKQLDRETEVWSNELVFLYSMGRLDDEQQVAR